MIHFDVATRPLQIDSASSRHYGLRLLRFFSPAIRAVRHNAEETEESPVH